MAKNHVHYRIFFYPQKNEKGKILLVGNSIQPNNHYKRKRPPYYSDTHPHRSGEVYKKLQYNSIQKPLKVNGREQPTFKGFYNSNGFTKLFTTTTEKLPSSLSKFTFEILSDLSEKQHGRYKKIIEDLKYAAGNDKAFRRMLKISDEWAKNISEENLPSLPQKGQVLTLVEAIFSPITTIANLYKPIVRSGFGKKLFPKLNKKLLLEKTHEDLIERYRGFVGLSNSIKIWENSYRQFSGHGHWHSGDEFLIPKDVLKGKIQRRRPKEFDPGKGKYSTKSSMLVNRLISGLIYAVFLATDAYNTAMKFSGKKEESQKQQRSRFAQENARIGLNLYLSNLVLSAYESQMNKSMANALLASGATVAFSEAVGRILVSKPIMPSDKKTLDAMEQEMMSKKGFLPALGRLMTRVKKSEHPMAASPAATSKNIFANPKVNLPTSFSSFKSSASNPQNKQVSFTGFAKSPQMFDSANLKKLLDIIEDFDGAQYNYYKETIEKGFRLAKNAGHISSEMDLDKAYKELPLIPIGDEPSMSEKITHSIFAPIYWIQSAYKSVAKLFKDLNPKAKHLEMKKFIEKNKMEVEFQQFLKEHLSLPVWQKSRLEPSDKERKILEEFVDNKNKIKEEVQGVKNMLLWLDKQIKSKKFNINDPKSKSKLEDMLQKAIISADASKHQEYDGNTVTQLNVHLSRIITTIFLVTDAYNLTMQYSNDNKSDAKESAKKRAIQEVTRISISAYMLGFIHNLLSKVCNSSIIGVLGVTALTSVTNDSLARIIVGVPLTPKTQEELLAKDKKKAANK